MHIFASLDNDGAAPQLDEAQGGKESTRTCTHDNHFGTLVYHRVVGLYIFIIGW